MRVASINSPSPGALRGKERGWGEVPKMESESSAFVNVHWNLRPEPLTPRGVAVRDHAALALARRLLTGRPEALARLQGVHAPGLLVVLGDEQELPWVDGSVYLGREAGANRLLIPTTLACSVSLPLLERALCRQVEAWQLPLAVLPAWNRIISLGAARAIAPETLTRWLEENR